MKKKQRTSVGRNFSGRMDKKRTEKFEKYLKEQDMNFTEWLRREIDKLQTDP